MAYNQQWALPADVQSSLSALPDPSADLLAGTHTETAQEATGRIRDAAIAATALGVAGACPAEASRLYQRPTTAAVAVLTCATFANAVTFV